MNRYIYELLKFFVGKKVVRTTEYSKEQYKKSLKSYDKINTEFCPKLVEYVSSFSFEPKTVLEIGCGNGRNLRCIEKHYECYGTELSDYGCNISKENCKHSVIFGGSADKLPFDDNSIDLVFTVHALEQMTYILDDVVEEIYRVCKKGILLFEPLYEKQGFWGKLHNYNSNYSRGIEQRLEGKFDILSVEDAKYSKTKFNRTWVIRGEKCSE